MMIPKTVQHAEQLSALADGELDAADVARACAHWQQVTGDRATWGAYHLIGDVLRSEDLAGDPRRDRESLDKVFARLAAEPIPLAVAQAAPRSASGGASTRLRARKWVGWAAIAAGFSAVVTVLVVSRGPAGETGVQTAGAVGAGSPVPAAITAVRSRIGGSGEQSALADARVLRDARLDRYLDAHKQFSGVSALGVPSRFLRGATSDAANR